MNTNVFKIISQLVKKLLHEDKPLEDEQELINSLQEEGYELTDISQAFEFVFESSDEVELQEADQEGDFSNLLSSPEEKINNRVLTPQEKANLNLNVQGIVVKLIEQNLISEAELEETINQALNRHNVKLDTADYWQVLSDVVIDELRLALIEAKIPEFKVINAGSKEYTH
jgi:Smg protein